MIGTGVVSSIYLFLPLFFLPHSLLFSIYHQPPPFSIFISLVSLPSLPVLFYSHPPLYLVFLSVDLIVPTGDVIYRFMVAICFLDRVCLPDVVVRIGLNQWTRVMLC